MANPLSIVFKKIKKLKERPSHHKFAFTLKPIDLRVLSKVGRGSSSFRSRSKTIREKKILSSRLNRDSRMTLLRSRLEGRAKKLFLLLLVIGLVTAGITFFPKNTSEASWYSDNWHFRKKLTIDAGQVSGSSNLTDFPVLVSLTDGDLKTLAQDDGDDIVFTTSNGSTPLKHEIESYSEGTLVAWVKIPTLSYNTDTVIYMYYGNTSTPATEDPANVWDSNYKGVWHLSEDPSGTPAQMLDSTVNDNDGTSNGSMTSTDQVAGKVDGSLDFDGNDDYIDVQYPSAFNFVPNTDDFTLEAWIKTGNTGSSSVTILGKTNASANQYKLYLESGNHLSASIGNVWTYSGHTLNDNVWHHVALVNYDDSGTHKFKYVIDGVEDDTIGTSGSTTIGDFDTLIGAGRYSGTNEDYQGLFPGKIDNVRVSSTARSPDWIATEYNNQSSPSTFFSTQEQEEKDTPVAYWKFDEGYGTNAQDSTPNNQDGTISGATWQDESMCVTGKCLLFDGSNDTVTVANTVSNIQTVEFWAKPITSTQSIISFDGTAHSISASSGALTATGFGTPIIYVDGQASNTLTANAWQHIAVTTATSFDGTNIQMGLINTTYFKGYIDDVKIYDYARSAGQIKADYNSRGAVRGTSARFGPGNEWMSDGLVGYWKMDFNGSGDGVTVPDSSGNSNNGLTENGANGTGMNCTGAGKFGYGCDFDGSDDYVDAGNPSTLQITQAITISAWVNVTSNKDQRIVSKNGGGSNRGYQLRLDPGTSGPKAYLNVNASDCSTTDYSSGYSSELTLGSWYQVTGVFISGKASQIYINGELQNQNTTVSTSFCSGSADVNIGRRTAGSAYLDGLIDDVRIYNRALSASEVERLYKYAPGPVAYYSFDEGSGTSLQDRSGNGNTGILGGDGAGTDVPTWGTGKYGGALSFDGSDDYVAIGDNTDFDYSATDNLSFMAWVKLDGVQPNSTSGHTYGTLVGKGTLSGTNPGFSIFTYDELSSVQIRDSSENSANIITGPNLNNGNWHHVAATVNRATQLLTLYTDGVLISTADTTAVGTLVNNDQKAQIGETLDSDSGTPRLFHLDGKIDDVRIYNYARTAEQIAEDMNAGHPAIGTPVGSAVGQWKFDEGALNTCSGGVNDFCDSSGQGNDLVFSTTTGGYSNSGKNGKAFNGTGAVWASKSDDADFDFAATDSFTIAGWIKSDASSNPGAVEYVVNKANAATAGYALYTTTNGYVCIGIDDDTSWGPDIASCNATSLYDSSWHHLVAVRDTTADETRIYIDGISKDNDTDSTTATLANSLSLYIADRDGTDNGDEFSGDIDELSIYRFAVTSDQVKLLYNQGKQSVLGSLSQNTSGTGLNSSSSSYCPPGDSDSCVAPVLEMNFEENTGQYGYDTSGNGNTGTLGSGATADSADPSWTTGYGPSGPSGAALSFDGVNDYLNAGTGSPISNLPTSDFTISYWQNFNSSGAGSFPVIMGKTNNLNSIGWSIYTHNTAKYIHLSVLFPGGTTANYQTSSSLVVDNTWQYITVVWHSSSKSANIYINGSETSYLTQTPGVGTYSSDSTYSYLLAKTGGGSSTFKGLIDQLRIYNYARTPAQIAWDMNKGAPVAWYKFDECSGVTANDASGNGNNGTITIGVAGSNTTPGSCSSGTATEAWNNGTTGKWGASLDFDGSDDYVTRSSALPTDDMTLSAWIKHPPTIAGRSIISEDDSNGADGSVQLRITAAGLLEYLEYGPAPVAFVDSTTRVDTNTWTHVVVTKNSSDFIQLYINAKADGSGTISKSPTGMDSKTIGALFFNNGGGEIFFDGQIDDVRIYNYALTDEQVKEIYNNGAVNFQ